MTADTELIKRIAGQDKSAFEELYLTYYKRIFRFVLRMTKDSQLAEETVNDTLYAVWKSAGAFQGGSKVSTWILGIAYRQSLNALKKQMRHKRENINLDNIAEQVDESPYSDPQKMNEMNDFAKNLTDGINTLSTSHAAVVQLTSMGYSYTEISQIVECPVNTVKTRMFHARKQLQLYLKQRNQLAKHQTGVFKSC